MVLVQTPQLNNKHYYAQFDGLEACEQRHRVWMHGRVSAQIAGAQKT